METDKLKEDEEVPQVERQGWSAKSLADEAANKSSDEIVRKMLRGDETEGNPDERDIVGGVESSDTDYGRRQTKRINSEENNK